jgi:hypothetical protein
LLYSFRVDASDFYVELFEPVSEKELSRELLDVEVDVFSVIIVCLEYRVYVVVGRDDSDAVAQWSSSPHFQQILAVFVLS